MKQEIITIRTKETAARIQASEVAAVRVKDITKKGVRVYRDGLIGVAGTVGDTPEDVLLEQAAQNLQAGIKYPYPLTQNLRDHRCLNEAPMSSQELLEQAESVLNTLRKDYPDFSFSESIASTEQIVQMRKMGGIGALLDKLPAQFAQAAGQLQGGMEEKAIRRIQGIIDAMTPQERANPDIIKASRKRRIAAGAGVTVQEVNRLLKQFDQTQRVMKQFSKGGMGKVMRGLRGVMPRLH